MSEYKNIIGKGVRFLSSNLDNDQAEGQIWYNSTDDAFKNVIISSAWSAGANLNTARNGIGSFGIQTSNVAAGGSPYPGIAGKTEEYNGTGWTNATALPGNTGMAGAAGTETAGLVFGGLDANPGNTNSINLTREYDGSSWTSGGNMNNERSQTSGFGIQTAAVVAAGFLSTTTTTANSEEYNGTARS